MHEYPYIVAFFFPKVLVPKPYNISLCFRMKVPAAYLLAVLGGSTSPSADDLKHILGSVGAEADEKMIELFLSQVKGKDIAELIASGREKLASFPYGAGGGVAVASDAARGGGGAPAASEPKKEEKVDDIEESDDDIGFTLFDFD